MIVQGDHDISESANGASAASECPFLSKFDSFAAASEKGPALAGAELVKARGELVKEWLIHHPAELFAELRAKRPVLVNGGPVPTIVAKSADVMEVLRDNDTFPVKPYQNPINTNPPPAGLGHFLLADLVLTRHDREKEAFSKAMRSGEESRADIRAHGEYLIGLVKARGNREIDVIKDVAERLPIRMIGTYFGVPTGGKGEMPEGYMYLVIGRIFRGLFMNLENDAIVQADAEVSSGTLRAYVDRQLQARKAQVIESPDIPADILGRFSWFQGRPESAYRDVFSSDERVVANLCGIMTGAVVGFVQAIGNIVDVLSTQDASIWEGAVSAATSDRVDTLWAYAQEALRFRPQGIGIVRATSVATTLSGVAIPAGNLVLASHQSAMMDEKLAPEPSRFILNRPASSYLHFGFARNKCLGIDLAPVIITEALRVILRLKNVRRPPESKLEMGELYPESFVLSYDS